MKHVKLQKITYHDIFKGGVGLGFIFVCLFVKGVRNLAVISKDLCEFWEEEVPPERAGNCSQEKAFYCLFSGFLPF